MVLLKRKPIIYAPLPSLATILQPLTAETAPSSSAISPPAPGTLPAGEEGYNVPVPPDAETDEEQMEMLTSVFRGEFEGASGHVGQGKGKKAGTRLINQPPPPSAPLSNGVNGKANGAGVGMGGIAGVISGQELQGIAQGVVNGHSNGNGAGEAENLASLQGAGENGDVEMNGQAEGDVIAAAAAVAPINWRIWDRECWFIPETGEIFTDYE